LTHITINPENIKPTYSQIGWEYKTINVSLASANAVKGAKG